MGVQAHTEEGIVGQEGGEGGSSTYVGGKTTFPRLHHIGARRWGEEGHMYL